MRYQWLFLPALLVLGLQAAAQMDSKVTTGVLHFQQNDHKGAIAAFDAALADISQLKGKNVPKAYYYRGVARMGLARQAAVDKDMNLFASINLLDSHTDFQNALRYDDGKWADKTQMEQQNLRLVLLQMGIAATDSRDWATARLYIQTGIEITADYVAHDLLGRVEMGAADYPAALEQFNKSIALFQRQPPARPDLQYAYVFYQKSLILAFYSGEYSKGEDMYYPTPEHVDGAFASISQGLETLDGEWQRIQGTRNDYPPNVLQREEQQYQQIKQDLKRFELDMYLRHPDKREEALLKFEQAAKDNPNDYNLHVAFANLLESTDFDRAVMEYEVAIMLYPRGEVAHYNLGALYTNRGVELMKAANEELDFNKAKKGMDAAEEWFTKAKLHFEQVYQINPESLEAVQALMQICVTLGQEEEYLKYREVEKRLRGG